MTTAPSPERTINSQLAQAQKQIAGLQRRLFEVAKTLATEERRPYLDANHVAVLAKARGEVQAVAVALCAHPDEKQARA